MGNTDSDYKSLIALATNAELNGGTVDMTRVGPTYRRQAAAFLRELASRIDIPLLWCQDCQDDYERGTQHRCA